MNIKQFLRFCLEKLREIVTHTILFYLVLYLVLNCAISGYLVSSPAMYMVRSCTISWNYHGLSRAISGYLWLYLTIQDCFGLFLNISRYLWLSLAISGYLWLSLSRIKYYGASRSRREQVGAFWNFSVIFFFFSFFSLFQDKL